MLLLYFTEFCAWHCENDKTALFHYRQREAKQERVVYVRFRDELPFNSLTPSGPLWVNSRPSLSDFE
mgnify:CR=1 FL=1